MSKTMKDVAKGAGVSVATVSRVINNTAPVNEETRKKILEVMNEIDYKRTSMTDRLLNSNNTIGVIVSDISNPFFTDVVKGISNICDENNFNIMLCDCDEDIKKEILHLKNLQSQSLKGIIITPTSDTLNFNKKLVDTLSQIGIPVVLIDRDLMFSSYDGVFIDNIKGAFDATNLLIENGHNDIAIISGPVSSIPGRERLKGYKQAFAYNDMQIDESNIFYGDFKKESGYEIAKKIFSQKKRPTAIFSCNNMMTMGCLKAAFEFNIKIPDDISLVAFDKVDWLDFIGMKITSVSRPTIEMGKLAMEMLLERINEDDSTDNTSARRVTLSPTLEILGSEIKKTKE